jgi:hypothetical protein
MDFVSKSKFGLYLLTLEIICEFLKIQFSLKPKSKVLSTLSSWLIFVVFRNDSKKFLKDFESFNLLKLYVTLPKECVNVSASVLRYDFENTGLAELAVLTHELLFLGNSLNVSNMKLELGLKRLRK